jgi:hypothetical protein
MRMATSPIWTNHALQRLSERGIKQHVADLAFNHPDASFPDKDKTATRFQKRIDNYTVIIVAKKNDDGDWIIISCWRDPPLPHTFDFKKREGYRTYRNASFWGKVWITVKRQLGISKY